MDVFLPEGNGNDCCIFFIHGGGWKAGDKKSWHANMEYFAKRGFVCTSANYHLRPKHKLKEMVEDVRLAMSFVKEHAKEWKFDPNRIAAYGSSAGGHLVGMLSTIDKDDELGITDEIKIRDTKPNVAICVCPVLSLTRYRASLVPQLLGETWPVAEKLSSPENRVSGKEPPFLIVVGDKDTSTPFAHQQKMKEAVEKLGGTVEIQVVEGAKHGSFYGVKNKVQRKALTHIVPFLEKQLKIK